MRNPYDRRGRILLRSTGLLDLFRITEGTSNIKIALIDGPVCNHPNLEKAHIEIHGPSGACLESAPAQHATFLASMLVGRGTGMLGLCPGITLLNLVSVDEAALRGKVPPAEIAKHLSEAVLFAVRCGAAVILMGLEFAAHQMLYFERLALAIRSASARGVRTIIPAGNSPRISPSPLLSCPGVVPVGMTNSLGSPDARGTWGPAITQRGLMAPGVDIPGAALGGGFALRTGTSYAAAFVAGAFALVLAASKNDPDLVWSALLRRDHRLGSVAHNSTFPQPLDVENCLGYLM
jgi:hypothetical protein